MGASDQTPPLYQGFQGMAGWMMTADALDSVFPPALNGTRMVVKEREALIG
jgi:hypothetical protein